MNKENITKLKMKRKRDGVSAGTVLFVCFENSKLTTKYNGTQFGERWIMSAIQDGIAKPTIKEYG